MMIYKNISINDKFLECLSFVEFKVYMQVKLKQAITDKELIELYKPFVKKEIVENVVKKSRKSSKVNKSAKL